MIDVEGIVYATLLFGTLMVLIVAIAWSRREKARANATAGGDYRRLADEAVRGQRVLLEEVQRMNATLKEIERLLREV